MLQKQETPVGLQHAQVTSARAADTLAILHRVKVLTTVSKLCSANGSRSLLRLCWITSLPEATTRRRARRVMPGFGSTAVMRMMSRGVVFQVQAGAETDLQQRPTACVSRSSALSCSTAGRLSARSQRSGKTCRA